MASRLLEHKHAIVFVVGLSSVAGGVGSWSAGAAAVVVGVVLMGVAAYPFLRRKAQ